VAENFGQWNPEDCMSVERIIEEADMLAPIMPAAERILQITGDPTSSVSDLVEVIQYDQAVTANLLRICNSSYFGLSREINSVKQAAAYLGMDKVTCLVMMGSGSKHLSKAQEGYDLNEGELWRYSVASALMTQELAEKYEAKGVSLLFTAALLKDIGKVILSRYVKELFAEIMTEVRGNGLSFMEAERTVLGIDHAELGSRVAAKWRFSREMVDLIRNHHNPDRVSSDDLSIPIVYLSDCICMMMGIGLGSDGLAYRYYPQVTDRLGFSEADLQRSMIHLRGKLKTVEELVSFSKED
jgi:putative nucleotidyltransferase with HDIG domain